MRNFLGWAGGRSRVEPSRSPRILVYESEAIRIAQYALSSPSLEIGGDLFGFFAPDGSPLVFIASGPGPRARRGGTHFQQDPEFQARLFHDLASKFRMFYVGDWHSHHGLGLSEPSGSDDAKLEDLATKNAWPRLFSAIVQTDRVRDVSDHSAARRGETSRPERNSVGFGGPMRAYGVWWNAFQYSFNEPNPRQRVAVEFQSGANPHEESSASINAAVPIVPCSTGYPTFSRGSEVAEVANGAVACEQADEFTINTYRKLCRVVASELPEAEMEVDLKDSSGARLIVSSNRRTVACRLHSVADASLTITISSKGLKNVVVKVPCPRGEIDPVDVRAIALRIVEQLQPPAVRGGTGN